MMNSIIVKLLLSVSLTSIFAPTKYMQNTGVYYADTQSVVDEDGEEWGFDADIPDGSEVLITYDTKGTEYRFDDAVVSVAVIE